MGPFTGEQMKLFQGTFRLSLKASPSKDRCFAGSNAGALRMTSLAIRIPSLWLEDPFLASESTVPKMKSSRRLSAWSWTNARSWWVETTCFGVVKIGFWLYLTGLQYTIYFFFCMVTENSENWGLFQFLVADNTVKRKLTRIQNTLGISLYSSCAWMTMKLKDFFVSILLFVRCSCFHCLTLWHYFLLFNWCYLKSRSLVCPVASVLSDLPSAQGFGTCCGSK